MNPQQFQLQLRQKEQQLAKYVNTYWPVRAGNIALRFINENFRAQGYQDTDVQRWKPIKRKGTILVKTGALRAANYYTTQPAQVRIKNSRKYARMHNEGFNGIVHIPEHTRRLLGTRKVGTGKFTAKGKERTKTVSYVTGTTIVKAHERHVNIAKRQFMPTSVNDSRMFASAVRREIEYSLKQIFG